MDRAIIWCSVTGTAKREHLVCSSVRNCEGGERDATGRAADRVRATLRNENSCPPEAVSTPFYIESDRPSERGIAISTIRIWLD